MPGTSWVQNRRIPNYRPPNDYFNISRWWQPQQFDWLKGVDQANIPGANLAPITPDFYQQYGQSMLQPGKGGMRRQNKLADFYKDYIRAGYTMPDIGAELPVNLAMGTPFQGFTGLGSYFGPEDVPRRTSYSNFPMTGLPGPAGGGMGRPGPGTMATGEPSGRRTINVGGDEGDPNAPPHSTIVMNPDGTISVRGGLGGGGTVGGGYTPGRGYARTRGAGFERFTPQEKYMNLLNRMGGPNYMETGPAGSDMQRLEALRMMMQEEQYGPLREMLNPMIQSQLADYTNLARHGLWGPQGLNTYYESFIAPQDARLERLPGDVMSMVRSGRDQMIGNQARNLTEQLGGSAIRQPGLANRAVTESVLPTALASDAGMSADLLQNVTGQRNLLTGQMGDLWNRNMLSRLQGTTGINQLMGQVANMVAGGDARAFGILGREDQQAFSLLSQGIAQQYGLQRDKWAMILQQEMEAWLRNNRDWTDYLPDINIGIGG